MKKVIMIFEKPGFEVIGILYNSVDVHALDVECFADVYTEFYANQDYSRFEGHWFFDNDEAYETWYAQHGKLRDEHFSSLKEYLEVNEVDLKIYSEIQNTRIPDTLPFDQYITIPNLIRVHR